LPSFRLANRVSDVPQPKNHPKTNHCPTSYLHQQWSDGDVSSTHPVCMHGWKTHEPNEQKIHSSWGWRCLVKHRKPWLNCVCGHILYFYVNKQYCNYIWYILCITDFYVLGLRKKGENVKKIPSKSHVAADFTSQTKRRKKPHQHVSTLETCLLVGQFVMSPQ
jgi:hypothetical protein